MRVKLREWFTKDDPFWVIITKIEFLVGEGSSAASFGPLWFYVMVVTVD